MRGRFRFTLPVSGASAEKRGRLHGESAVVGPRFGELVVIRGVDEKLTAVVTFTFWDEVIVVFGCSTLGRFGYASKLAPRRPHGEAGKFGVAWTRDCGMV